MSERAPKTPEIPSLEWLVANWAKVLSDADHMTAEHVNPGDEDAAIFKLGKYKMDYIQPLYGKVQPDTGGDQQEDQVGEATDNIQINDLIMARVMNIEHRCAELERQKDRAKQAA